MTAYQLVSKEKGGQSVRQLLRLLWDHLSRHRRRQLKALLFVMLISSLAEVLSLAAVLPFLAVLPTRALCGASHWCSSGLQY